MQTLDLEWPRMAWVFGMVLIPWLGLGWLGLRLSKEIAVALLRMTIQLGLIGLYLKYLFALNHPGLNALWILVMLVAADLTTLRRAGLPYRLFFATTFIATALSVLFSTAWLILIVIRPEPLYEAQYLVPLTGMILGNCLHSNIVALERFFALLHQRQEAYYTYLVLGATRWEAVRPLFQEAVRASIGPMVGGMATMGLVSLPGMMTGQILGGSDPWVAVKYQIAIMLCIFTSAALAAMLNIGLSLSRVFNAFDGLRDLDSRRPARPA